MNLFRKEGFSGALNRPFSETIVPARYYRQTRNVLSLMIEVNRKLYMDEATGRRSAKYELLKSLLGKALQKLGDHEK